MFYFQCCQIKYLQLWQTFGFEGSEPVGFPAGFPQTIKIYQKLVKFSFSVKLRLLLCTQLDLFLNDHILSSLGAAQKPSNLEKWKYPKKYYRSIKLSPEAEVDIVKSFGMI